MSYIEDYHVQDLTPVEEHNGIYYKRDDLYTPFDDIPLSGGKVRQAICLIGNNYNYIQTNCNSMIYSSTGMESPQGIIVTRVAKEFGFESIVFIGHSGPKGIRKSKLMMNILTAGGKINYKAKMAYESTLNAEIRKHKEAGEKFFHVKFGINLDSDPESILGSVSYQVQNLPDNLDYLIVPCGSCIMLSGIIQGCEKYNKIPKHIVGIQISGYDRTKTIENILGSDHIPYEFLISKDYDYHRYVKVEVGGEDKKFTLDPIYEAKAHDYMTRHMADTVNGKRVCFWVVGNSIPVRTNIYNIPKR